MPDNTTLKDIGGGGVSGGTHPPVPSAIELFVKRVAENFKPERIILFGSWSRGTAGPESDVDLLVVVPHEGHPALIAAKILGSTSRNFALDLIVRSPERLRERVRLGDPFFLQIMEEGRTLYESAPA